MSNSEDQQGPLTIQQLIAIWQKAVDKGYSEPFLAAGEGNGFEAYTQGFAQYERTSQAIDTSTQAMYILPWSGQTNDPASGNRTATCTLQFQRNNFVNVPIIVSENVVLIEERTNDWGTTGPVPTLTRRKYFTQQDILFLPGDTGPHTSVGEAENPGYGYNNPLIGTINFVVQPGTGFNGFNGTVVVSPGAFSTSPLTFPPPEKQVVLTAQNIPDMFIPEHIGQYLLFTAGANSGTMGRIVNYFPPNPSAVPPMGSGVQIEILCAFISDVVLGVFNVGEIVEISNITINACGVIVQSIPQLSGTTIIVFRLTGGTMTSADVGGTCLGTQSGASATIDILLYAPNPVSEAPPIDGNGGASWKIMDWANDLGVTVANIDRPVGGKLAMLDMLGEERGIFRAPSEVDEVYRKRIHQLADVVTPNAIVRSLRRALGSFNFCFREVGLPLLPGFFFTNTSDPKGDFFDYETLIFEGVMGSGTFIDPTVAGGFQEKVIYFDSIGTEKCTGYLGQLTTGATVFWLIRKSGFGTFAQPAIVNTGDMIVGQSSGAVFLPTVFIPTTTVFLKNRFRILLDYASFRAYFLVGVPRLGIGEFGFPWGVLPLGSPGDVDNAFFDASLSNAFDGFPFGNAAVYRRVFASMNDVKAGGVGYDLYEEDATCV